MSGWDGLEEPACKLLVLLSEAGSGLEASVVGLMLFVFVESGEGDLLVARMDSSIS